MYGAMKLASGLSVVIGSNPTAERIELALTIRCGYLDDPEAWEGLAHLAEHITLATDAAELGAFIEDRVGALNAFTAEQTTTYHCEFDIDGAPPAETEEVCRRFAALFPCGERGWQGVRPPASLVQQELRRIDAEWQALLASPPRQAMELAALKRRARSDDVWRRFGRGTLRTMPLAEADRLSAAVNELRSARYSLATATLALTTSLPLDTATGMVRAAFDAPSRALSRARLIRPWRAPPQPSAAAEGSVGPHATYGPIVAGPSLPSTPLAVEIARGGRSLTLAWRVPLDDPVGAARAKPLALLGMALTSPHAGGLSASLRASGLSPPVCVQEPVVLTRTLARTREWTVWQVDARSMTPPMTLQWHFDGPSMAFDGPRWPSMALDRQQRPSDHHCSPLTASRLPPLS